jgi:hypothetical protein
VAPSSPSTWCATAAPSLSGARPPPWSSSRCPGLPRRWELLRLTPAGLVLRAGRGHGRPGVDRRRGLDPRRVRRARPAPRGRHRGDRAARRPRASRRRRGPRAVPGRAPAGPGPDADLAASPEGHPGRSHRRSGRGAGRGLAGRPPRVDPRGSPQRPARRPDARRQGQHARTSRTPSRSSTPTTPIFADPAPTAEPPPADPGPATAPTPRPTEPTAPTTGPRRPSGPATGPAAPALDPQADAARLADLLFASDGDAGKLRGDLSDRRAGTDLAQQLDELAAKDGTASIGDQSGRTLPAPTGPQLGTRAGAGHHAADQPGHADRQGPGAEPAGPHRSGPSTAASRRPPTSARSCARSSRST